MRYKQLARTLIPALALAATPALALADAPRNYFGLDLMSATFDDDGGAFANDFDDRSAGMRLSRGFNFNHWFGIEGAFQSLGNYDDGNDRELRYRAMTFSGVGRVPIAGNLEAYGRLGLGVTRVRIEPDSGSNRTDTKGLGTAGIGLEYRVSDRFSVRGGVDRYSFEARVGPGATGSEQRVDQTIDTAYIGVTRSFGWSDRKQRKGHWRMRMHEHHQRMHEDKDGTEQPAHEHNDDD